MKNSKHLNMDNPLLLQIIAHNLRQLRKKHKISQKKLFELTGIHRVSIGRYENAQHLMSLEHMLLITQALGESPLVLLEGCEKAIK